MEWPRLIRSELHVESLKRPKHAVHEEWLGTLLMTRTKYSAQHPQLYCEIGHSASILDIGLPCTIGTLYTWSYTVQTLCIYMPWWVTPAWASMVAKPTHAQMPRGCSLLTPTNASQTLYLSTLSHLFPYSLWFFTPKNTHWCTRSGGVVPQSDREEVLSRRPSGDSSSEWGCCRVSRRLSFVPRFLMHGYLAYYLSLL